MLLPNMECQSINFVIMLEKSKDEPCYLKLSKEMKNSTGVESLVRGIFLSDKLPVIQMYPSALIANKDPHDQPKAHWIAMYLDDEISL